MPDEQTINLIVVAVVTAIFSVAVTIEVGRKIRYSRARRQRATSPAPSSPAAARCCRFGQYVAVIRDPDSGEPFISLVKLER